MKPTGKYFVNPPKKKPAKRNPIKRKAAKRKARKKNPVPFTAIVANPVKKPGMWIAKKPHRNPIKKRRKNPAMESRAAAERRHLAIKRKLSSPAARKRRRRSNPIKVVSMKTKRRRGKSRRRNPISRRGGIRRAGRRRSTRRRNPIPGVSELFPMNTLATAGSAVVGGVVINTIVNKFAVPTTARPWKLPGIDASMLVAGASPEMRATFWIKNAWALALWKAGLGGIAGWALRNQAPRLSYGFTLGSLVVAGNDVLKATKITTADGTLQAGNPGAGRMFLGGGVGFVPGVNPQLTGPAQAFLGFNNVPRPRGLNARVGPGTMQAMSNATEGAFKGAN